MVLGVRRLRGPTVEELSGAARLPGLSSSTPD